jgi:hypothetical protein
MNETVHQNLLNLFNQHYNPIQNLNSVDLLDSLINDNPDVFDLDLQENVKLYNEDEIEQFLAAKENSDLATAFKQAVNFGNWDSTAIIQAFQSDIRNSFSHIDALVSQKERGFKNQIIFLEHDFAPRACFCGFGTGAYPLLETPSYFDYNYHEELYNGEGSIDYSLAWQHLITLNEQIEALGLEDAILDTEIYQNIAKATNYKTFLLLFEAFKNLGLSFFKQIPIELPLFIYGNEHDCEAINIFIFENI